MKRIHLSSLVLLPLMLITLKVHAQEGVVTYEETVTIEFDLPSEMEHMREHMPSARVSSKQLFFNEVASLMRDVPGEGEEGGDVMLQGGGHDGGMMHFRVMGEQAEDETYVSLEEGSIIEKRDFLGRTFLITGELPDIAWRLSDERSEFLGYASQKATAVLDSTTIEAWFTPEIPLPVGPEGYGGLPGLILVLNLNDGKTTFVAQELSLGSLDEGVLVPPTKGRKVTREAFNTIVEEKMKEMEAEGMGEGNVRFIIRGN